MRASRSLHTIGNVNRREEEDMNPQAHPTQEARVGQIQRAAATVPEQPLRGPGEAAQGRICGGGVGGGVEGGSPHVQERRRGTPGRHVKPHTSNPAAPPSGETSTRPDTGKAQEAAQAGHEEAPSLNQHRKTNRVKRKQKKRSRMEQETMGETRTR